MTPESTRVLVVDDNVFDQQILREYLSSRGYQTEFANDGEEALPLLEADPMRFDLVLADRTMPRMNGLELLARIKQNPRLRTIPVIMQTASSLREEIFEGIRAGAYYYLTKPYDVEMLLTVVETAARDFNDYRHLKERIERGLRCLTLVRNASFSIQSVEEARDLGMVLANACPDPMSTVIGLTEILVNAVEHGNLGITYEEKSQLNAEGQWESEVTRRLSLPENAAKRVEVQMTRNDGTVRFIIRDEGLGFDWKRFIEIDPQRAFDNHGRGIVIARTLSFDSLEYRGCGNEVVAQIHAPMTSA
ncbi:MAG TPA: response regulator [Thermoanaerobaculia bacterium]|jgi:CheY-like chemotaxis protein/anti-sigma regulatory factor (Ser/Thr protein kinase)|nr:response regulator [Thermoanaerobaculia bacterium]